MSRDDIIRMAREAGLWPAVTDTFPKELERFAVLVSAEVLISTKKDFLESYEIAYMDGAEAEREECAKVCKHKMPQPVVNWSDAQIVEALRDCAAAIRARGKTK